MKPKAESWVGILKADQPAPNELSREIELAQAAFASFAIDPGMAATPQ